MPQVITLKDVNKELKSQTKSMTDIKKASKGLQRISGGGGFLSKLAERTEGVPLIGGFVQGIADKVEAFKDGFKATKRMMGFGDAANKKLAEINRMGVKDYNLTQKENAIAEALANNQQEEFKATVATDAKMQKFYDELTEEQRKAIAVNDKGQIELLTAVKDGGDTATLLQKVVEQGKETIKLEEDAKEARADARRKDGKNSLTMLERLKELGSKSKDKMGGIGKKGKTKLKGAGGFVSNMLGDFFGSLTGILLGPKIASLFSKLSFRWMRVMLKVHFRKLMKLGSKMVAPVKVFAKMAGRWLIMMLGRALAFMNPYVLLGLAIVGILVYFSKDIIKWVKDMWGAITGFFENINWGDMFIKILKVIFFIPLLIFKLGKKLWGAITGFFEGFSLENMMSKLKDLSIVKYIIDLKDKIVNGFKSFILKIVPETFFKYPLRAKVAKMLGVTLPGGSGTGDEEMTEDAVNPNVSTKSPDVDKNARVEHAKSIRPFADKSADVFDPKFAKRLSENALAKTAESKGGTNILTSKGGNVVTTNQSVTNQSTSIVNNDPVYGKFLYGA